MISIIIPIYNAEKTIGRCINSILCQNTNQEEYELILIDDGSTDCSAAICKKYTDTNHNVYYFYQQNNGASSARNQGIKKSRGEWIVFVDADDILECNFLPLALEKVKTGSDLYIFNINQERKENITFDEMIISSFHDKVKLIDSICGIKDNSKIRLPKIAEPFAKIYKRELLNHTDIKFDERLIFAEDMLFNICVILEATQIECINKIVYSYMYNPESLTQTCHITDLTHPEYFLVELEKISNIYPPLQRAYEFLFINSFWTLLVRDFASRTSISTFWKVGRDYNKLLENVYPYSVKDYKQIYKNRRKLFDVRRKVIIGLLMYCGIYPSILAFKVYKLLIKILYIIINKK